MAERLLATWNPSDAWNGLKLYLNAVHCALHCIEESTSGRSHLSPSQEEDIVAWGCERLSRLCLWLRDLEWTGLHVGCIGGNTPRPDAVYVATFPYVASHYFVKDVVDPLIELCSTTRGNELVSKDLASAVEHAWSSARLAYPNAIGLDEGRMYIWCTGLDRIDGRLAELRRVVDQVRDQSH